MKKSKRIISVSLLVCVAVLCCFLTSCGVLDGIFSDPLAEKYAGTYAHEWSGLLMYNFEEGDGSVRDYEFTLEKGKKGTWRDGDEEVQITWSAPTDEVKDWLPSFEELGLEMEIQINEENAIKKMIGINKVYVGYMTDDGGIILYDGSADDGFVCRYYFKKVS
ncbi:MAG: hypothetical protein K6D98_03190 [Clostridiales bacterium]|nr:hypothetical protein [Clostridia bacterium]MCR5353288.1 hypothetical protein [Clostridiales bacterium]